MKKEERIPTKEGKPESPDRKTHNITIGREGPLMDP